MAFSNRLGINPSHTMKVSQQRSFYERSGSSKESAQNEGATSELISRPADPPEPSHAGPDPGWTPQKSRARSAPVSRWLFAGVLLFVIMPFLFWRMTWFGG